MFWSLRYFPKNSFFILNLFWHSMHTRIHITSTECYTPLLSSNMNSLSFKNFFKYYAHNCFILLYCTSKKKNSRTHRYMTEGVYLIQYEIINNSNNTLPRWLNWKSVRLAFGKLGFSRIVHISEKLSGGTKTTWRMTNNLNFGKK